jgi:hypothetical protein
VVEEALWVVLPVVLPLVCVPLPIAGMIQRKKFLAYSLRTAIENLFQGSTEIRSGNPIQHTDSYFLFSNL